VHPNRPIAVIDIGSNSIHLTLARVNQGRIETLLRLKDAARLAAHLGPDGRLDARSVDRAIATLARFRDLADVQGAEMRATATAALRAAGNRDVFIARAKAEAAVEVELITGHAEAALTYRGVRHGLPQLVARGERILTVDVGGGSSDLAVGRHARPDFAASVALGSLNSTTRYLQDPVTKARLRRAWQALNAGFEHSLAAVEKLGFDHAVATSGSIQRLARLLRPNANSLHGSRFTATDIDAVTQQLAKARTHQERRRIPGMDPERADSLLGGALVYKVLTHRLGITEWTISVTALRTGLILDTHERRTP
jgi:exopolyphosphatase/guanosine-5'-triphosphate,3'-diphosphate pyrophosphatase